MNVPHQSPKVHVTGPDPTRIYSSKVGQSNEDWNLKLDWYVKLELTATQYASRVNLASRQRHSGRENNRASGLPWTTHHNKTCFILCFVMFLVFRFLLKHISYYYNYYYNVYFIVLFIYSTSLNIWPTGKSSCIVSVAWMQPSAVVMS